MTKLSVVHLVWGPLGAELPKAFADSYVAHSAGVEHDLLIVFNGVAGASERADLAEPFADLPHRTIDLPKPVIDLEAYRQVVAGLPSGDVVFLNSYARILADDWLVKLTAPLGDEIGLTGVGGSYQSLLDSLPPIGRIRWRRSFAPFPNPHIRTNAFALSAGALAGIRWPHVRRKKSAWKFENGRRSLYRRVKAIGLEGAVVAADGAVALAPDWEESHTFCSGDQENLLVADHRSDSYQAASPAEREELRLLNWGPQP